MALQAILGEGVRGLSPANIVSLKQIWEQEYYSLSKRQWASFTMETCLLGRPLSSPSGHPDWAASALLKSRH